MQQEEESRQVKFSGTREVVERLRFDQKKLEAYMEEHVEGFRSPLEVKQFKGGQSNPTYRLASPSGRYVLRRKPPGALLPSAHAVDREYRVMTALHPTGFPVPKTFALSMDESVVGTPFFIMEMVEGRIFWEGALPDLAPKERGEIYDAMNETIAALHQTDYEAIGLGDFGKPGNYFARQIARWSKQYLASETQKIPEMNKLIEWLPQNIPDGDETSIVHGDYRLDNMILHPAKPEVLAILDWELSTLGHPLGDFTYHLMQWHLPSDTGTTAASLIDADLKALGIPSAEDYIAAYCRRTGRERIENVDFYFAYNFFRLAGILQGIVGRVRDGTAASEHAEESVDRVRPLCQLGWMHARMAGAT